MRSFPLLLADHWSFGWTFFFFQLQIPQSEVSSLPANHPKNIPKTKEVQIFFSTYQQLESNKSITLPETNNNSSLKIFQWLVQMNSFPFGLQLGPCFKEFVSLAVKTLCWLKNGGPGLKMYFNLLKHGDISASYVIVYIQWPLLGIRSFPFGALVYFQGQTCC